LNKKLKKKILVSNFHWNKNFLNYGLTFIWVNIYAVTQILGTFISETVYFYVLEVLLKKLKFFILK